MAAAWRPVRRLGRKAALAVCEWPGFGYGSQPEEAADRLVEFCTGLAAAAEAAGLGL